jgi:hypothetical protein
MTGSKKKRAPKVTETQEHLAIASYFRKTGLGGLALAIHVRNERGSDWERLQAARMGIMRGLPDWLILDAGRAGWIELKPRGFKERVARTGTYTPHERRQLETHAKLKLAGCWVDICETLGEVQETLRAHGVPLRTESITTERIRRGFLSGMAEAGE